MGKDPKFQHTISELFIKRFSIENSNAVWNHDKLNDNIKRSNVSKASVIKNFYTTNFKKENKNFDDYFIEKSFAKIESQAKSLLSECDKFTIGYLSSDVAYGFVVFVSHLFVRSPCFVPDIMEIGHAEFVDKMHPIFHNDFLFKKWKEKMLANSIRDTDSSLEEQRVAFISGKYKILADKEKILQYMMNSHKYMMKFLNSLVWGKVDHNTGEIPIGDAILNWVKVDQNFQADFDASVTDDRVVFFIPFSKNTLLVAAKDVELLNIGMRANLDIAIETICGRANRWVFSPIDSSKIKNFCFSSRLAPAPFLRRSGLVYEIV